MSILKVENLKKTYHTLKGEVDAIKDISFELQPGEFIAIVGPSGCGKSTILKTLCNLETKSNGQTTIDENVKLGYMSQGDSLFEWRTVLKNCLLGLEINNELTDKNKNNVVELLKTYGLGEFVNAYPNHLSGGMRQRVSLIRTLATNPDILLLDEPFSALDYQSRLLVSDDVYKILKKEKKSAIMVTHDIGEAISMADRVIVLTNRPCLIKKIYKIKFNNKSTPINNRRDEKFNYYYDLIWKDIDYHV